MTSFLTQMSVLPLIDWAKSPKRTVVCVSVSRQHVWLLPCGRKCTREDERHVKVPGFWKNINLPIRPEITWPGLTLPVCLSMRKRKRSGSAGCKRESVKDEKWNWKEKSERSPGPVCKMEQVSPYYKGVTGIQIYSSCADFLKCWNLRKMATLKQI